MIIWQQNGNLKAATGFIDRSNSIVNGTIYHRHSFYLGDVDYLRNNNGSLIGFAYIIDTEKPRTFYENILHQSGNIALNNDFLMFFLKSESNYSIQTIQAIGTELFFDPQSNFLLDVPDWGFGDVGFALESDD